MEERIDGRQKNRAFGTFLHIMSCCRLLEILQGDNRAIFQAASFASKAASYIMPPKAPSEGGTHAGAASPECA